MDKMLICEQFNEKAVSRIMCFLETNKTDEITKQKVRYTLLVILGEAEKIVILSVIFGILGYMAEFLIAFLGLAVLRMFMGGSHRKTMLGCFFQSGINFTIVLAFGRYIQIGDAIAVLIYLLGIVIIWNYAPVMSQRRIVYSKARQSMFKLKALSILFGYKLAEDIMSANHYNYLLSAVLLQLIEVAILGVKSKRKGDCNDERAIKGKTECAAR